MNLKHIHRHIYETNKYRDLIFFTQVQPEENVDLQKEEEEKQRRQKLREKLSKEYKFAVLFESRLHLIFLNSNCTLGSNRSSMKYPRALCLTNHFEERSNEIP